MDLEELEAPEADRVDSQSALDFMYWMLGYTAYSYPKDAVLTPHDGSEDPAEAMMQPIMFSSDQIGLSLITTDYSKFRKHCLRRPVSFTQCIRDRGGILFRDNNIYVALGDSKRVMQYLDDDYVVRYLSKAELEDSSWECARIPDMIYL